MKTSTANYRVDIYDDEKGTVRWSLHRDGHFLESGDDNNLFQASRSVSHALTKAVNDNV